MSGNARPLRVYAERDQYSEAHRKELNDILKSVWNNATAEERRQRYGRRPEQFEVVSTPDAADVHLLTMKWQHYLERGLVDQAKRAIDVARRARKPIAVFSLGDFVANLPVEGRDIHVFQPSAYRSRTTTSNHGMPAFIEDPLASLGMTSVSVREKGARPVVGFCGQAGSSLPRHAARFVRTRIRQLRWRLGREQWEPTPLEHTWFRQRVLDAFARSSAVETRYVLRTKYRAGVHTDDRNNPAQQARADFLNNVLDTDYTVCVRGGGNFSVRFYEALALGRIPAFVDTDCILPYHDIIEWRRYIPWIDETQLRDAGKLLADFHSKMSPAEFREHQVVCRRLWEERLTADGFYDHFREHFPELR